MNNAADQTKKENTFGIVTQYVKDISFEAPNSPSIFFQKPETSPSVEVNIDIKASKAGDKLFNVDLTIKATNKLKDKTLFLIETIYSAVVKITADKELEEKILLIEVPKFIFPFARSLINNITKDSGLPPLTLAPIDFKMLYENRKKENKK